jgi:hypothetical protein
VYGDALASFRNTGAGDACLTSVARGVAVDLADVDHAEAVAFRISEDDVVRVRRSLVPVDLGRTQREQALDLARLIVRVQVEVDARRDLQRRANLVEGEVRPDAVSRT